MRQNIDFGSHWGHNLAKKAHIIGPHSRPTALAKLDRRTREARHLEATIDELIEHVGGQPSATQRRLIERTAWLELHIELMDRKAIRNGAMTERDAREYLAWANSYRRALASLGLDRRTDTALTLGEYVATKEVAA